MSIPLKLKEDSISKERIEIEIDESGFLNRIGKIFSSDIDLKETLDEILKLLAEKLNITRGSIALYNEEDKNIFIDTSYGYTSEQVKRGKYKPGEGITGSVIKNGKPIVVPSIDDDSLFLNRTGARKNKASRNCIFICVPIAINDNIIGTVSIDKVKAPTQSFSEELNILTIVSIMTANTVNDRRDALRRESQLKEENRLLKIKLSEKKYPENIIGNSKIMQDLYEKILLVAPTMSTVLISGESGTGKELVADAIYRHSTRSQGPFIKVNIAAFPDSLIESELFGYDKGAFTGAINMKKGRFEMAEGGTIFLDEIGDLNLQSQVKLLRVLQEKSIERLGGTKTISLNVRIIAATHQNLEEKVKNGEFRHDLYYRLNVFQIFTPSLQERKADIMHLADYFLDKFSEELDKNIKRISTEAINMLVSYHWPGNVRELENCIQRAAILSREDVIRSCHLPPSLQIAEPENCEFMTLEEMTDQYIKEIIIDNLKITGGNITRSAERLGTTKRILNYKMNKLNIDYRDFRQI